MPGERVPLIARAVGTRILRPRPGLAIVSFWQGIVEVVLRSVALVLSLAAIIPAAIALSKRSNSSTDETITIGGAAVVILVGAVGIALQTTMIIIRFLNIGLINMNFRIFGIVDMVLAGSCAIIFLVGTVIAGYSSHLSFQDNGSNEETVSLGVAAGLSFLSMLAFSMQAIWMFVFVLLKWNKHVVTHTLRDAILS